MVKSRRNTYFVALFLFFICLFVSIYPDVFFFKASFVKRDIFRYYYPVWKFSIDHIRSGQFPLWNPYSSYGTPFFANIQSCVLYPLSILLYLPDYNWAFNAYILLHLALSGFLVSVWMASCGASRAAQLLSGLSYGLGGYVMSSANVTISLCALCYFPLVLLCLKKAFNHSEFRWKVATAATLLVQYLAGDPAIFFASILTISLTVGYETIRLGLTRHIWSSRYVWAAAAALALFFGMGAFHVLLFVEFLFHSNRSVVTTDIAARWSLYYNDLISIIIPHFSDISTFFMDYWSRQSWVENNYAGVTVMVLALISIRARKSPMVWRHLLLALFGVLLSLGPWGGVHGILYQWFPFFKFIRYPARFMFLFSFAIACLAGFGLDALWTHQKTSKSNVLPGVVIVLALLLAASHIIPDRIVLDFYALVKNWLEHSTKLEWTPDVVRSLMDPLLSNLKRSVLFAAWILAAVWLAREKRVRLPLVGVFVVLLVFADLVEANVVEQRVSAEWLAPQGNTERILKKDTGIWRYMASPHTMQLYREMPRFRTIQEALFALSDGMAPNHHLDVRSFYMGGYDSIYLKEGVDLSKLYRQAAPDQSLSFVNMVNAKYMINSDSSFSDYYPKLSGTALGDLCLNEKAMPRAFLVEQAAHLEAEKTAALLFKHEFDPRQILYLDDDAPVIDPLETKEGDRSLDHVEIERYTINQVEMNVTSSQNQWLFFSDSYYPGWVATVNGQRAKIHKANFAFRAVQVPKGISKVEWKYEPILFRIGMMISLCTWAACLMLLLKKR